MCHSYNITPECMTVKNPQAQALVKRIHLTMGEIFWTATLSNPDWTEDVDWQIQTAAWAIHTTIPSSGIYYPSQMAFGSDMLFCHRIFVDWEEIKRQQTKQTRVINSKVNKKHIAHKYKVGDKVMIVIKDYEQRKMPKLSSPTLPGYFVITKTYSGSKTGTVCIDQGAFQQDISICRLVPYYEQK